MDDLDEVRNEILDEANLVGLKDHPGWAVYRTRLIARLGVVFQEFLVAPVDQLAAHQGAGRALWDQLREVDGSENRRAWLEREVQRRHEAAVEEERRQFDMAASAPVSRFREGPRRPGVPLG